VGRKLAKVNVKVLYDTSGVAETITYNIEGFPVRTWLGLYLNDVLITRFRTDNSGGLSGSVSIPSEYQDICYFIGGFSFDVPNPPSSGTIMGQEIVVEDTFNDGVEEFPTTGTFSFDLRYD
jgi:hypothetical protein